MGMFYRVSDKQLLKDRNELFKKVGIPALENNGFLRSVFKTSWDGQYNKSIKGYSYQVVRLQANGILEIIDVYILSGEPWIQIYLNIFELEPKLESVSELSKYEGLGFGIPPNSITKMRLRNDDYRGPPLFYMLFLPEHKIRSYYTKSGYEAEINNLKTLIKSDMESIDNFVKRWHKLHKPNITDWEGKIITKVKPTIPIIRHL